MAVGNGDRSGRPMKPPPLALFTYRDKLACVERELAMRLHIYPRWIAVNRMTREKADREIALMQAIVADYRDAVLVQGERERLL